MKKKTSERILLVDDDQALLDALRRTHRKQFDLSTACGGPQGLETLAREGPFAVVVSDYKMPEMDGITFLGKVSEAAPDTVRVMLTGNADLQSAIEAVNRGRIFRFLTKPCPPELFAATLDAALEQWGLRQSERILLEQTVRGSIEVLADVLALANPDAFGRSSRVRGYVRHIVSQLGLRSSWQVETAALLSQIGYVAIPTDIIERVVAGETLPPEQADMLERHPAVAQELLGKIPRLEAVAEMVAHQRVRHDDPDDGKLDASARVGSEILAAALDFDELVSLGASPVQARSTMARREGAYAEKLVEALSGLELAPHSTAVRVVAAKDLRVGMTLEQDVRNDRGSMILAKGNRLTPSMLARLRNYARLGEIPESIRVRVEVSEAKTRVA